MQNLIIYLVVYLISAIPFGLVLARIFAKVDIKNSGSKSIGATNVLRVVKQSNPPLAKKLAIATVVLDFSKAFVPILILKMLGFDAGLLYSVAVLCVVGHCFSIYLMFDGGKGVATGAGAFAMLLPLELLCALVVWAVVGKLFKVSSLASLSALLTLIISSFVIHFELEINTHAPIFIIATIVLYKHLPNIKRMFFKQECKVI